MHPQTKQGEMYYHIPLHKEEYFLFSRLTPLTPPQFYSDFFLDLLTSERPEHKEGVPFIVIRTNAMSPKKINWGSFNERGLMEMLKSYTIESKQVIDELKHYAKKYPIFVRQNRKLMKPIVSKPSPLSSSSLLEKEILKHLQNIQRQRVSPVNKSIQTSSDSYKAIVLFFLVVLSLVFLLKPRKVAPLVEDESFTKYLTVFINKIQNEEKRKHFKELLKEIHHEKKDRVILKNLQTSLRTNPAFSEALLSYLEDVRHDPTVVRGTAMFLTTLPKKTKERFVDILETVSKHKLSSQIHSQYQSVIRSLRQKPTYSSIPKTISAPTTIRSTSQQQTTVFSSNKLPRFFRQNKQMIVSPTGAVSPVFTESLDAFLKQNQTEDIKGLKQFIYQKARRLIKENPKMKLNRMNNLLENAITKQQLELYKNKQKQQQTIKTIESVPKTRRRIQQSSLYQQPQQQQRLPSRQQQEWIQQQYLKPRVQRTKKQHQTEQMADIVNVNIQNIMASKKYKKVIETLTIFLENHPTIRKIYVVDAPNLLFSVSSSFRERQQLTVSEEFVKFLRQQNKMGQDDMIILISQMNLKQWFKQKDLSKNDPITFNHILNDRDNIFHIQVGCVDTTTVPPSDCFRTIGSNEIDDFVRLDLMTRLADLLKDRTFIELSNDVGRNWKVI